jgi:hypothetical protein
MDKNQYGTKKKIALVVDIPSLATHLSPASSAKDRSVIRFRKPDIKPN